MPSAASLGRLVAPLTLARERVLPVAPSIGPLLPEAGLRRGSSIAVDGSTWLALALVAGASASGSWCAAVGMPSLGMSAAAALGCDLSRFALVPDPGSRAAEVAAALADALDIVIVGTLFRSPDARRLASRVRERGAVLITCSPWPERTDVRLRAVESRWEGAGEGWGHLQRRTLVVESSGRGAASMVRRTTLLLL